MINRERLSVAVTKRVGEVITNLRRFRPLSFLDFDPDRRVFLKETAIVTTALFGSALGLSALGCLRFDQSPWVNGELDDPRFLLGLNGTAFSSEGWKAVYGPHEYNVDFKPIKGGEQTVKHNELIEFDGDNKKNTNISIELYYRKDRSPVTMLVVRDSRQKALQNVILRDPDQILPEIDSRIIIFRQESGEEIYTSITRNASNGSSFQVQRLQKVVV